MEGGGPLANSINSSPPHRLYELIKSKIGQGHLGNELDIGWIVLGHDVAMADATPVGNIDHSPDSRCGANFPVSLSNLNLTHQLSDPRSKQGGWLERPLRSLNGPEAYQTPIGRERVSPVSPLAEIASQKDCS